MASTREADAASSTSTAKFLQARITALSTSCIKRLENIFAAALNEEHTVNRGPSNSKSDAPPPPTLTETAVKQLQLDVESSALIRSAEEFMILTRTLKELWLFGGLETIKEYTPEEAEIRRQIEADEKLVVEGFLDLMAKVDDPGNDTADNVQQER